MSLKVKEKISLQEYNTFHVPVTARFLVTVDSAEDSKQLISHPFLNTEPRFILGGGSNILFTQNFPGIVLLNRIEGIRKRKETNNEVVIEAGSGMQWDDLVKYCVDNSYYGAENLSLIPGTVGAAAVQNIGAYGADASGIIDSITGIDLSLGKEQHLRNHDCRFGYRTSIFKTSLANFFFITSVKFRLSKIPEINLSFPQLAKEAKKLHHPDIHTIRNLVIRIRRNKLPDPDKTGNAGSFFKNPILTMEQWEKISNTYPAIPHYPMPEKQVKIPAAWLIEQCGWKGKQSGRCGTWPQQPLVIINIDNASGKEILSFSKQIQESVKKKFDIFMEPEVLIM